MPDATATLPLAQQLAQQLSHQRPVLDTDHPLTPIIVALETAHAAAEGNHVLHRSRLEPIIADLVALAGAPRAASLEFNERTGLNVAARHPAFFGLARSVVAFFDETKAEHHVTVTLADPLRGAFDLTVQRRRGLSPAERNSALCRVLRQVRDRLNDKADAPFVWSTRHDLVDTIDAALGAQREPGPSDAVDPIAAAARQVETIAAANRELLAGMARARDAIELADATLTAVAAPLSRDAESPDVLARLELATERQREIRALIPGLLEEAE